MTREDKIVEAIEGAIQKGIKIWPGAVFDWTNRPSHLTFKKFETPKSSGELPSACNAIGALELVLGRTREDVCSFTTKVCEYLNVGTYWLYRFHMGFDQGRQLVYKVKTKSNKIVDKECEVSKLGILLRSKYHHL